MWTSQEDAAAHPRDLNLFGGLRYDERFHNEKHEKKPFEDLAAEDKQRYNREVREFRETATEETLEHDVDGEIE